MRKVLKTVLLAALAVLSGASMAFAAGKAPLPPEVKKFVALAAGFGIAIASATCGIAQGRAISSAMEGIGRNPEASGKILTPMIIGLAMIEALCIYSLVIALMLVTKI